MSNALKPNIFIEKIHGFLHSKVILDEGHKDSLHHEGLSTIKF
jgi:hypothetical protein